MSSTPESKPSAVAKTPGWGRALFGMFSSQKAPRDEAFNAMDTPGSAVSVARSPAEASTRMDIQLTSPPLNNGGTTAKPAPQEPAVVDLLDSNPPMPSKAETPWKPPPQQAADAVNSGITFSLGTTQPSERKIHPRTNKRAQTWLKVGKRGRASSQRARLVLDQSQKLFQSSQNLADQQTVRFRSMRQGRKIQTESRVLQPSKRTSDDIIEEKPAKRAKVNFASVVSDKPAPVVEMVTPAKPKPTRQATPFKPAPVLSPEVSMTSETPSTDRRLKLGPRPEIDFQSDMFESETLDAPVASQPVKKRDPSIFFLECPIEAKIEHDSPVYFSKGASTKLSVSPPEPVAKAEQPKVSQQTLAVSKGMESETKPPLTKPSSGWGNLFSNNNWKCSTCLSQNPQDKTACMACEEPRPGYEDKNKSSTASASAPSASIGAGGFSFGGAASAPADDKKSSASIGAGGFSFGAKTDTASSTGATGFSFGAKSETKSETKSTATTGDKEPSTSSGFVFSSSSDASKPSTGFSFGSSHTISLPVPSQDPPTASAPAPAGASLFEAKTDKKPTLSFGKESDAGSSSEAPKTESTKPIGFSFASTPAPAPAPRAAPFKFNLSSNGATPAATDTSPKTDAPAFSFGAKKDADPEKPATESKPAFSFGATSKEAETTSAPAPKFSFGAPASEKATPSFSFGKAPSSEQPPAETKAIVPLGSIRSRDEDGTDDRRKKRRGRGDDDENAGPSVTPAPSTGFSFGGPSAPAPAPTPASTSFSFGSTPSAPETKEAAAPAGMFGGTTTSDATDKPAATPFKFGSTAPSPAPDAPAFGSTPASAPAPAPAFSFGSTPAPAPAAPAFGSTPAPAPAAPAFGSTPAPAPAAPAFGSAPAPATPGFSFGSAPAPETAAPAFGSAPAAPAFGSAPAPAAFGSTPAPAPAAPAFGSAAPAFGAPAPAASFGSAPAPAFGNTPAATPAFGSAPAPAPFGGAPSAPFGSAPPAAPQGFGAPAPAPFGGFGGAPAAPAPQPGFGGAPAPGGFGGGFGAAPPAPGGFGAPPPAANGGAMFSMGSGGGTQNASKTPGRRRIVRARRPGGSRPA